MNEKTSAVVLIAEDESEVRRLLVMIMELEGYTVLEAEDGAQALSILREQGAKIRLLITDLGLPKIEGVALIEEARKLNPAIRVIAASGFGRAEVREEVMRVGADVFLGKPFVTKELITTARELLGKG